MADAVHLAAVALQVGILVAGAVAVRRSNVSAAVNAVFALTVAFLPSVLASVTPPALARTVATAPILPLWLAAAGFIHVVGMLGWYDSVWWWDHLTHTVSAALLAALVYGGLVVIARTGTGPALSTATMVTATVGFVFLAGVFWELIELIARTLSDRFGVEPVLVHYGWRDTGFDLLFDVVGAVLVVVADVRVFVSLAAASPSATRTVLVWVGWTAVVGTIGAAAVILVGDHVDLGGPSAE